MVELIVVVALCVLTVGVVIWWGVTNVRQLNRELELLERQNAEALESMTELKTVAAAPEPPPEPEPEPGRKKTGSPLALSLEIYPKGYAATCAFTMNVESDETQRRRVYTIDKGTVIGNGIDAYGTSVNIGAAEDLHFFVDRRQYSWITPDDRQDDDAEDKEKGNQSHYEEE